MELIDEDWTSPTASSALWGLHYVGAIHSSTPFEVDASSPECLGEQDDFRTSEGGVEGMLFQ